MISRLLFAALVAVTLAACGGAVEDSHTESGHEEAERGPHGGRLLEDGDVSVELEIFEENSPPRFRLYVYREGKIVAPDKVRAIVHTTRIDGQRTSFELAPEKEYLTDSAIVTEPHSFDVDIEATVDGKPHAWKYAAYEGRVTIAEATAREAGVVVQPAGPAVIRDVVHLVGTVTLNPDRHAHLKARFPGTVRDVRVSLGATVRRGQTLLVIESNESMREYAVTAPFDGVVLARETNVGDVTGDHALVEIADLSQVWLELHALGDSSTRIAVGQPVRVASATTQRTAESRVSAVLPLATRGQSVVIRAKLDNARGEWRPGMTVSADVVVAQREVPLAVRESALQRFRDFTVVFAKFGDLYEVRMVELGVRDGEHAEVLAGLDSGTTYVTEQSFLIKADIEKSAASHDH